MASRTGGRLMALDGIRGLAVLLVVVVHGWQSALPGGYIGVDVFFVLSGFLITTVLLDERAATGRINLPLFYARRALRLLPALFVLLAACQAFVMLEPSSWLASGTSRAISSTVGYFSNWMFASHADMGALVHTWSLSLEEQFYLLWPGILMALLISRRNWVALFACGAGIVQVNAWRLVLAHGGADWTRLYSGFDTRADALLAGCGLAIAADLGLLQRVPRHLATVAAVLGAGCIALVSLRFPNPASLDWGGYTLVALSTAALITVVTVHPFRPALAFFRMRWLVCMGQRSYTLYLWDFPVQVLLFPPGGQPPLVPQWASWAKPAQLGMVFAVSWLLATATWFLVERPCLRMKARLSPSASPRRRQTVAMPQVIPGLHPEAEPGRAAA